MIHAYHIIITTYGFWLPNDPRGSWSDWVRQWELVAYGKATKVSTRRSVAARPHDYQHRLEAKKALRYPPVSINGRQALAVAVGFKRAIAESGYVVHACSILPQHAHLVIAHCGRRAEQITANHCPPEGAGDTAAYGRGIASVSRFSASRRDDSIALGAKRMAGLSR